MGAGCPAIIGSHFIGFGQLRLPFHRRRRSLRLDLPGPNDACVPQAADQSLLDLALNPADYRAGRRTSHYKRRLCQCGCGWILQDGQCPHHRHQPDRRGS